jgi:lipopolysaccharide transport system ATP-binding protein
MSFAIRVDNLGKRYRLGATHAGSIREVVNRAWKRVFGRQQAVLPHEEAHIRGISDRAVEEDGSFWALRDLSFEVHHGEVVGIVGRNGSGKSTLLKILSQITAPTTGRAQIHGRVASLLEVGTGFHPELSGRENVFLNGAILGMTKAVIRRKFDEIVAFSEIDRFLDTPVKRYSSGMYVRLAFAVAAHLDADILVVDEVLAVGDAAFQNKCLGKMGNVAKEGRTVLLVSHSMGPIAGLSSRVLVLEKGALVFDGPPRAGIEKYMSCPTASIRADLENVTDRWGPGQLTRLKSIALFNASGQPCDVFSMGEPVVVELELICTRPLNVPEIGIALTNTFGTTIHNFVSTWEGWQAPLDVGLHRFRIQIPRLVVHPGTYLFTPWAKHQAGNADDEVTHAIAFTVVGADLTGHRPYFEKYSESRCEVYCPSTWSYLGHFKESKNGPAKIELILDR